MSNWIVAHLWLVPAVPLVASLAILSLANTRRSAAAGLAIAGQVVALLLSLAAFAPTLQTPGYRVVHNFTWFTFGEQTLRLGFVLDPLTAVMLVMITFVSLCIFVFSVGYMAADQNFGRFFAYLSFFSAAMLGVVIANSLLLLFICWELVGLASYLLIGFWIHKPSAAAAAKKAFITTRIGDIGFFLGMLWLYGRSGTLLFYDGGNGALESAGSALVRRGCDLYRAPHLLRRGREIGAIPAPRLVAGRDGRSDPGQRAHPCRHHGRGRRLPGRAGLSHLFVRRDSRASRTSLTVVVWVGVITALISALIALAQADIKRILAYSTVSQLGLMMVSLGVGGVAAGIMHLLAHGFFKALLFLGSGSVIHGCHEEQDIRKMGGLRGLMPVTFLTYAIGMMALSGVPLFFAGAWTKEEILHATSLWSVSRVPHFLMLAGVVLTALYMTRQMIYVFFGPRRAAAQHAHESPPVMTWPLTRARALHGCVQRRAHAGLAVVARLFVGRAGGGRSRACSSSRAFTWRSFWSRSESGSACFSIAARAKSIRLSARRRRSFVFSRTGCGSMNFTIGRFSPSPGSRRGSPIFSIAISGTDSSGCCGGIGQLVGSLTKGFDERGINAGVNDATGVARGLGRLISARHSGQVQTYLGVDRGRPARASHFLRMAHLIAGLIFIPILGALFVSVAPAQLRAARRARELRHHRACSRLSSGAPLIRRWRVCKWSRAMAGFPRSAPSCMSGSMV